MMYYISCEMNLLTNFILQTLSTYISSTQVGAGVYSLLSHPMYGGLLMLCVGYSMLCLDAEKLVLSAVLGFSLVSVA